jgi:hypothetical protein
MEKQLNEKLFMEVGEKGLKKFIYSKGNSAATIECVTLDEHMNIQLVSMKEE